MKNEYNSYFFNDLYEESGDGNYLDSARWIPFFSKVAQKIVDQFNPTTVLDAGCACGYLVAALRDLGVHAYGFDVSKFAISNVREDIKDYCFVHNIVDPLPKEFPSTYDLVVTSEVLELLFPQDGEKAIELLCNYSDTVIFSSSPSDIEDRTHVNVQLPEYWAELFYNNSFAKNFIFDMTILSPWCVVYEKFTDLKKLIFKYEQNMRIDKMTTEKNVNDTINDLMESLLNVTSRIYFEGAEGFSDEKVLLLPQKLNDSYLSINIRIPEHTKSIKFAPIESEYCLLKNVEIYLDNRQIIQYETNGERIQNYILYNNLDPYIIVNQTQGRKHLKIHAKFQHVEEEFLQLYQGKNKVVDETIHTLSQQVANAEATYQDIQDDLLNKDAILAEKETEINNKTSVISMQTMSLEEKDATIAEKDGIIAEKTAVIAERDAALHERDMMLSKNKELLEEQALAIQSKDALLVEKLQEIEDLKSLMASKDAILEELQELSEVMANQAPVAAAMPAPTPVVETPVEELQEEELPLVEEAVDEVEELPVLEETVDEEAMEEPVVEETMMEEVVEVVEPVAVAVPVEENSSKIEELEAVIVEKDAIIAEKDDIIAGKDAEIKEKEVALSEKSTALMKKETAYNELAASMEEKDAIVAEKENAFLTMDDELVQKNLQISSLEGRLNLLDGEYQSVLSRNDSLSAEVAQLQASSEGGKGGSLFKAFRSPDDKGAKDTKAKDAKSAKEAKAKKEKAAKDAKKEKAAKDSKGKKPTKDAKAKKEKAVKEKPVKEAKVKKDAKAKKDTKGKKAETAETPEDDG